mgnify:CR=1 FL=1
MDPDPDVDLTAGQFADDHAHLVVPVEGDEPGGFLGAEPLARGVQVRELLGRSPDKGDSVAMTFVTGIPEPGSATKADRDDEEDAADWRM